jgi:hypothetical protein
MKPFNITTNGITKLLKNLNPYKAQGPDNLSPRILKELADEISPLRNPCCSGYKMGFFSACCMMFLAMICSRILQQTDVSEIGR